MANLSEALKQAYARSSSSTRHLMGVELTHSTFGSLAMVNYDEGINVGGTFHTAMAMEIREPEVGSEPANEVKVRIDGTPGEFQFYINQAVMTGESILCNIRPFAFNMSSQTVIDVVGTYPFLVTTADYDMTTCVLHLGHVSPTNQKFPGMRYTAETHPGMY